MTITCAILCNECGDAYDCYDLEAGTLRDKATEDGWVVKFEDGWIQDYCPNCT